MTEVSFEWADGPCANYEYHRLHAFSPDGEKIEPRMERIAFHKNGKWSYADLRVFVPAGSIIVQLDCNTHGTQKKRAWVAVAGRPEIFSHSGKWLAFASWPLLDNEEHMSNDAWHKALRSFVAEKVLSSWNAASAIEAI